MSRNVWISCATFRPGRRPERRAGDRPGFRRFPAQTWRANQFVSNCKSQGGNASIVSASSDGGKAINCSKTNGSNVTCAFDERGTVCVGCTNGSNGGRPL